MGVCVSIFHGNLFLRTYRDTLPRGHKASHSASVSRRTKTRVLLPGHNGARITYAMTYRAFQTRKTKQNSLLTSTSTSSSSSCTRLAVRHAQNRLTFLTPCFFLFHTVLTAHSAQLRMSFRFWHFRRLDSWQSEGQRL